MSQRVGEKRKWKIVERYLCVARVKIRKLQSVERS